MKNDYHSDCEYCKAAGQESYIPKSDSWITCPLFGGQSIHMEHCKTCDYQADIVSNQFCSYKKTKEHKNAEIMATNSEADNERNAIEVQYALHYWFLRKNILQEWTVKDKIIKQNEEYKDIEIVASSQHHMRFVATEKEKLIQFREELYKLEQELIDLKKGTKK